MPVFGVPELRPINMNVKILKTTRIRRRLFQRESDVSGWDSNDAGIQAGFADTAAPQQKIINVQDPGNDPAEG
jgi:hypothetical protein